MAKNTHYVVWVGQQPGIYASWPEAERQVKGFSGSKFKGFPSLEAAELAVAGGLGRPVLVMTTPETFAPKTADSGRPKAPYLAVDAAYSHKTRLVEWRGVLVTEQGNQEVFRSMPYSGGSANVGEYLAIIDGIQWIERTMGLQAELPIYSDSVNAQIWVSRKAHSSGVPACREIMDKLSMADRFLQLGGYAKVKQRLPLRDWKTSKWGEIPADFGRK